MASFTEKSATARLAHSGGTGPRPRSGTGSLAQATSTWGAMKARVAEKAIGKKIAVSRTLPATLATKGAFHQLPARRRLKTATSRSWPTRKAVPEARATRRRDERAEGAVDLAADEGAGEADEEARADDAARGGGAVQAVHQVGDEEGEGIGEGAPGQPVADEELDEDVRGDDDRRHGEDAGEERAGHAGFPF